MPRIDIDMAGIAGVDEKRSPGIGDFARMFKSTQNVILAGNRHGWKRQWRRRIGAEGLEMALLRALMRKVRRRNEETAGHLVARVFQRMHRRCDAETMGDQHHRTFRRKYGVANRADPGVAIRFGKGGLIDATSGRKLSRPAVLPMVGMRLAQAWNEEDICF
jgi:hypothetical protein